MSVGESLGSEDDVELVSYGGMSCGELGYSVRSSRVHRYGKHEGYPLGDIIGRGFRSDGVSSDVRTCGEESGVLESCAPDGVSNRNFAGNLG